jgi:glutamate/tyrosine decarboxylase-like PLP-dependent enzyme
MTQPTNASETLDDSILLEGVARIAERLLEAERDEPVAPFRTPAELAELIDPCLCAQGMSSEEVLDALERVVLATPRTGSSQFFNQLFSGRLPISTAADMLACLLNISMYTYKVAGPHALIETALTQHMASKVGYQAGEGVLSPGGSLANLSALVMARNEAIAGARESGLDSRAVAVYASTHCHYSIRKACGMIGLGRRNLRLVDVDDRGRMNPDMLASMIAADRAARVTPIAIVATAGTTVRAAFDPLEPIAAVAKTQGVWLHVDGALGGAMLLSDAHDDLVAGSELADSWTWDAHKIMGMPLSSSVILCKQRGMLAKHFNEAASYLFQGDADEFNHGTRSIQCGRRNDAFKLWAAWKHFGDSGFTKRVDHLFDLALFTAREIERRPGLKLACEPESVNVCFEAVAKPSDVICETLRREQRAMVGHAEVNGRRVIRMACVNADMTTEDMAAFLDAVEDVAGRTPDGENAL